MRVTTLGMNLRNNVFVWKQPAWKNAPGVMRVCEFIRERAQVLQGDARQKKE